jgi:hypothetical protein
MLQYGRELPSKGARGKKKTCGRDEIRGMDYNETNIFLTDQNRIACLGLVTAGMNMFGTCASIRNKHSLSIKVCKGIGDVSAK